MSIYFCYIQSKFDNDYHVYRQLTDNVKRKAKGRSRIDNSETLAALGMRNRTKTKKAENNRKLKR
jgi:hypothetical protein